MSRARIFLAALGVVAVWFCRVATSRAQELNPALGETFPELTAAFHGDLESSRSLRIYGRNIGQSEIEFPSSIEMDPKVTLAQILGSQNPVWKGAQIKFRIEISPTLLAKGDAPDLADIFQRIVDRSSVEILSTSYGRDLVSRVFGCDPELLRSHLALTSQAAHEATAGCAAPRTLVDQVKPYGTIENKLPARLFLFLFNAQAPQEADAYTQGYGLTRFYLSYDELNRAHLIQLLAHELAVQFDGKNFFGPTWPSHFPEIVLRAQKKPGAKPSQRARDWISLSKAATSHPIFHATRNPVIDEALIAMRAFRIENAVLRELSEREGRGEIGLAPIGAASDRQACLASLWHVAQALSNWNMQLWHFRTNLEDASSGQVEPITLSRIRPEDLNEPSPDELRAQRLRSFEKDWKDFSAGWLLVNGKITSYCEFFTDPFLSGRNRLFMSGPRPRIGKW